jgi:hypothetical protein
MCAVPFLRCVAHLLDDLVSTNAVERRVWRVTAQVTEFKRDANSVSQRRLLLELRQPARVGGPHRACESTLREVRSRGGAVVLSGLRAKIWRRRLEQQEARNEPALEERSSGEEAIETADEEADEEAPSGMTRLKTDNL